MGTPLVSRAVHAFVVAANFLLRRPRPASLSRPFAAPTHTSRYFESLVRNPGEVPGMGEEASHSELPQPGCRSGCTLWICWKQDRRSGVSKIFVVFFIYSLTQSHFSML
jgi:hypothetical protein